MGILKQLGSHGRSTLQGLLLELDEEDLAVVSQTNEKAFQTGISPSKVARRFRLDTYSATVVRS